MFKTISANFGELLAAKTINKQNINFGFVNVLKAKFQLHNISMETPALMPSNQRQNTCYYLAENKKNKILNTEKFSCCLYSCATPVPGCQKLLLVLVGD